MTWEYLIVDIQKINVKSGFDAWGKHGWELVHCEFGKTTFGCVFKRAVTA